MSGITTGVGLISGIDTGSLINQLIQAESRPRTLAQQRLVQLQSQQASYLDIRNRLSSLRTAAQSIRTTNAFDAASALSSNTDVLTASAASGAAAGSYTFVSDRVVGTQRLLSRGYADRNASATGVTSMTFESDQARLDRDTSLALLNGGNGVSRGSIVVTDSSGASATIDLSRVASVNEVLEKINQTTGVRVRASIDGNRFVLTDTAGGAGTMRIADGAGYTTATSLGIAGNASGGVINGSVVYRLGDSFTLASLNDGNGVRFNPADVGGADLSITTRDGSSLTVDLGDLFTSGELTTPGVTSIGQLRERIASQTNNRVTVSVAPDGVSLRLTDTTTGGGTFSVANATGSNAATDLGITGSTTGATISGTAILASLNSTLTKNLSGGSGLSSGAFAITGRDGQTYSFSVSTNGSISRLLQDISDNTGGAVTASLSETGSGIVLTDNSGGTNNLIVEGAGAEQLGLDTGGTGVAASSVSGKRLQHQYITEATLLSGLRGGQGIGTGRFEIRGPSGTTAVVDIGSDSRTVGDIIREINSRNVGVRARINGNGDGIVVEKDPAVASGSTKIKITDTTGTVARSLRIAGEASDNTTSNFIDGSFETKVTFATGATLDAMANAINEASARAGVRAAIVNDGAGLNPFRLSLTSTQTGRAGRFIADVGGTSPGFSTVSRGDNARVFFGSDDPATAVLLESTTNSIDGVVDGLSIDLVGTSSAPVSVTVARDDEAVLDGVRDFVTAFNDLAGRIDTVTSFDSETNRRGVLLGDSTVEQLRQQLYSTVQGRPRGVSGQFQTLASVGVTVGSGGKLELDESRLQEALQADPQGVEDLFSARSQTAREPVEIAPGIIDVTGSAGSEFTSLGVAELIGQLADKFTGSTDGVLKRRDDAINNQITLQNRRLQSFDQRLAQRRSILERQFASMESALAQLQRQQNSLNSLNSLSSLTRR